MKIFFRKIRLIFDTENDFENQNSKWIQISRTFLWPFSYTFDLTYPLLNSTKLNCSSEVTLKCRGGGSGGPGGPWPPRDFAGIEKRTEAERDNLLLVAPRIFGPSAASELSKMRWRNSHLSRKYRKLSQHSIWFLNPYDHTMWNRIL